MRHPLLTLTLALATAGCAVERQYQDSPVPSNPVARNPSYVAPDIYADKPAPSRDSDLVRSARYTLTSTLPSLDQEDLMSQIIEVTIPATLNPTVGDAVKHALARSGYSLAATEPASHVLYSRPLPAAHYKLGPMKLRDTLQVLAGPAWRVKVDEVTRQVEFNLRSGYEAPSNPILPTATAEHSASKASTAAPKSTPPTAATIPPVKQISTAAVATPAQTTKASAPATQLSPPSPAASVKAVSPSRPLAQVWTAEAGSTLRKSVEAWGEKAGWRVIWEQDDLDYPIAAPLRLVGSFQDVIEQLFPLYDRAPRSFVVDGSSEQKVLHIAERKKK